MYRHTFQHEETGRFFSTYYLIHEIEAGLLKERMKDMPTHIFVGRSRCTGYIDNKQFTVFENDIVNIRKDDPSFVGSVYYCESAAAFKIRTPIGNLLLKDVDYISVVGNCFEGVLDVPDVVPDNT